MSDAMDLSAILRDLVQQTDASRSTLRLDVAGLNFPAVAEALADGIQTLGGNHSIDQRNLATVQYLFATHDLLIQPDVTKSDTPPPKALIEVYGVQAQVLAPILLNDNVLGWISVHQCGAPREWTEKDITAIKEAAAKVTGYFAG
ncbi:MAG: hypothetical protein JWQ95_5516 [Sphaerisporangium sp.]|nr:hypothetical protein [Sphaerisporangium sp.]